MLEDPEVELVYVATPHSHHYQYAKMCLEHGKHVLVEKAFTIYRQCRTGKRTGDIVRRKASAFSGSHLDKIYAEQKDAR